MFLANLDFNHEVLVIPFQGIVFVNLLIQLILQATLTVQQISPLILKQFSIVLANLDVDINWDGIL